MIRVRDLAYARALLPNNSTTEIPSTHTFGIKGGRALRKCYVSACHVSVLPDFRERFQGDLIKRQHRETEDI